MFNQNICPTVTILSCSTCVSTKLQYATSAKPTYRRCLAESSAIPRQIMASAAPLYAVNRVFPLPFAPITRLRPSIAAPPRLLAGGSEPEEDRRHKDRG